MDNSPTLILQIVIIILTSLNIFFVGISYIIRRVSHSECFGSDCCDISLRSSNIRTKKKELVVI